MKGDKFPADRGGRLAADVLNAMSATRSDGVDRTAADPGSLNAPPPGCSVRQGIGGARTLRAALRSTDWTAGASARLVLFVLLWGAIAAAAVLVAAAPFYVTFFGPLPDWFPVAFGYRERIGPAELLAADFIPCIFLLPFAAIGTAVFSLILVAHIGRVEVSIDGPVGRVRNGFGPFNLTRRFDPTRVTRVIEDPTSGEQNARAKPLIQIEAAGRTVTFGSRLDARRRAWLLGALEESLVVRRLR